METQPLSRYTLCIGVLRVMIGVCWRTAWKQRRLEKEAV